MHGQPRPSAIGCRCPGQATIVGARRPAAPTLHPPALRIRQLVKTYRSGVAALHGIDLDVPDGDFALLGPNGAGKSTTIGTVSSLVSKTAGRVEIFGHDLGSPGLGGEAVDRTGAAGIQLQPVRAGHRDRRQPGRLLASLRHVAARAPRNCSNGSGSAAKRATWRASSPAA